MHFSTRGLATACHSRVISLSRVFYSVLLPSNDIRTDENRERERAEETRETRFRPLFRLITTEGNIFPYDFTPSESVKKLTVWHHYILAPLRVATFLPSS